MRCEEDSKGIDVGFLGPCLELPRSFLSQFRAFMDLARDFQWSRKHFLQILHEFLDRSEGRLEGWMQKELCLSFEVSSSGVGGMLSIAQREIRESWKGSIWIQRRLELGSRKYPNRYVRILMSQQSSKIGISKQPATNTNFTSQHILQYTKSSFTCCEIQQVIYQNLQFKYSKQLLIIGRIFLVVYIKNSRYAFGDVNN